MSIYLDYNASAPIDERVLTEMIDAYRNTMGNPDSRTHDFGDKAREKVEKARREVADLLGIQSDEVIFTSGATESNNIALQGLREYGKATGKMHIVTTAIEHKAILETAKELEKEGFRVDFINPENNGMVDANKVINSVCEDTLLVSVMHVNNETGTIQPVKEIGDYLSERGILFQIDATQSFGKLVEELKELKYSMMSISAHKIGGPQGVGALILRKIAYRFPPIKGIMYGGQQEKGIRPGTIPVALVTGFGAACRYAAMEYKENASACMKIKKEILHLLEESGLHYDINGDETNSIPNTLNLCLYGVSSEALMISTKRYCGISNGSACNSKSYSPSHVLTAMGLPIDRIENSVRISWGAQASIDDIRQSLRELLVVAKNLAF